MRWAGNFAPMGERRGAYRILMGKTEGKSHLKDLGIDGKIILKQIFRECYGRIWTALIWHPKGQVS